VKRRFGPWMLRAMKLLRHGKALRGTPLDPFGWSVERRAERRAIRGYERDMAEVLAGVTPERLDTAVALARLPLGIRGFGHVKAANAVRAAEEREALLDRFRAPEPAPLAEAAE
jgi:indolepyruvate ferredoxin oxidoreductase